MIVWIAGAPWIDDYEFFAKVIEDGQTFFDEPITHVIDCGAKKGPDLFARTWAIHNGIDYHSAVRDRNPQAKGSFNTRARNWRAVREAEGFICAWDGDNNLLANMILFGHTLELPMYVRTFQRPRAPWDIVPGRKPPRTKSAETPTEKATDA